MPHVLLVDDDPAQAAVYARLLGTRGHTCEHATDARAAVSALAAKLPQAIVLDLGLPNLSGVDLIRTVRALPDGREIPILVLANAYLELESLAAWEAGADQVVGKATHGPEQVLDAVLAELGEAPAPAPAPARDAKAEPHDPALADFRRRALGHVRAIREALGRAAAPGGDGEALDEVATQMRRLQAAKSFGVPGIPQLAAVAEWLARALHAWPSSLGPSSLRTLAQALDAIERRVADPQARVPDFDAVRALAVDDDATCRLLVQQAFRKIHVNCDVAVDGPSALEAARTAPYELVVADVMMPGMDGFGFVAHLRELPNHHTTPVIYVTAIDGFDRAFAREPHGGADAIVKPYLVMELATKAVVHLLREPRKIAK